MPAPLGNKNAAKSKPWEEAIRKALAEYDEDEVKRGHALRRLARVVVRKAMQGDKDAWQEIGNRLDGKPRQSVEVAGDADQPLTIRHESV